MAALAACGSDASGQGGGSWLGGFGGAPGGASGTPWNLTGGASGANAGADQKSGSSGQAMAGSAGQSAHAESLLCQQYLACTAATNPPALGLLIDTYGEQGACWADQAVSLCEQACRTGLIAAHKLFPAVEECNACTKDADCTAAAPVCQQGRCIVACHEDKQCSEPGRPFCDLASQQCVACLGDSQCQDGPHPFCDPSDHTCVDCRSGADCPIFSPACDAATHTCRGCQDDGECPGGLHCASGSCVPCLEDKHCPAGAHCKPNHLCAQCQQDQDCPGGGSCDPFSGTCCAVNACQDQGIECGLALDQNIAAHPACLFLPAQCGSCAADRLCVQGACLVPPPKDCGSCPGVCGYVPDKNVYTCIDKNSSCDLDVSPGKPCSEGYTCESQKSANTGQTYSVCVRYCLHDDDCPAGLTCDVGSQGPSYGRCHKP